MKEKWPLLDILQLDKHPPTEKSAFRAIPSSTELHEIVENILSSRNITKKTLAKMLKVNTNSILAWCGRLKSPPHPIPLWFLDYISSLSENPLKTKIKIVQLIEKIRCGRTGTLQSFPHHLTPRLSLLIGAHVADGCISLVPNRHSFQWELSDQYKENLEKISQIIFSLFKLQLKIKKFEKANAWYIRTRKQIIPRFLIQLFDMPIGKKSSIVKEPSVLKEPEKDNRLLTKPTSHQIKKLRFYFLKGIMMFDGFCSLSGGIPIVGIGCKSLSLLQDIKSIFEEYGIQIKFYPKNFKLLTTSLQDAKNLLKMRIFIGTKKEKLEKMVGVSSI